MPETRFDLKRKLGPLPVWAWGGLLLAAVAGWWLWRRRSGGGGGTSPVVQTVTGSQPVSPQDQAYGGYPSAATPTSQMLDPETANAIAASYGDIAAALQDLNAQDNTTYAGVGQGLSGVQTELDAQASALDKLSEQIAKLALTAPTAPGTAPGTHTTITVQFPKTAKPAAKPKAAKAPKGNAPTSPSPQPRRSTVAAHSSPSSTATTQVVKRPGKKTQPRPKGREAPGLTR